MMMMTMMHRRCHCQRRAPQPSNISCSHLLPPLLVIIILLCHVERVHSDTISPIPNWEPSWLASAAQGLSMAISCRPSHDEECVLLLLQSSGTSSSSSFDLGHYQQQHQSKNKNGNTQYSGDPDTADNNNQTTTRNVNDYHGLKLCSTDDTLLSSSTARPPILSSLASTSPPPRSRRRWIPLGSHAIATMTGLVSDVDHIQKRLQRSLHAHMALYAEEGMSVTRLVRILSTLLQSATRYRGGRPRAMQAMVIGATTTTMTTTTTTTTNSIQNGHNSDSSSLSSPSTISQQPLLAIYTLDPSGGWQHYGAGATAIGRLAPQARAKLLELFLTSKEDDQDNHHQQQQQKFLPRVHPTHALQLAMRAMLETLEGDVALSQSNNDESTQQQQQHNTNNKPAQASTHTFEAVLIWKKATSHNCRVALVSPDQVQECHRLVWQELVKGVGQPNKKQHDAGLT